MRHALAATLASGFDPNTLASLVRLEEEAVEGVHTAPQLSPMETSDLEDRLGEWLGDHQVSDGWDLAPVFVQAGLAETYLERVARGGRRGQARECRSVGSPVLSKAEILMDEIQDSTTRVSTLIAAAKQYSQMDRAPYQIVDVHELLDSTLTMLAPKLGDGIEVAREYDRSLPPIPAYAAELNQVWTNLIDNAIGAMGGTGRLTIRTCARRGFSCRAHRGHRAWRARRDSLADLRALLHDQAVRRRNRSRARYLVAHRRQQASR